MIKYKRVFCLSVLVFFMCANVSAQNLVPNSGFEEYTTCPYYASQINYAFPWKGTNSSSDFHHSCANFSFPSVGIPFGGANQYPFSGDGVASFYMLNTFGFNFREYIQAPLITTLSPSRSYHVKFYCLLDNRSGYAVNNFGCHFSINSYTTPEFSQGNTVAPYTPQIVSFNNPFVSDTVEWTLIEGVYYANGGENYITIGNFSDDLNTDTLAVHGSMPNIAYYYFDDVSVEEITQPFWQYHDTTIYYGDSVLIGPALTGLDIDWYTDNLDFISNAPGIYVTPPTSRDYIAKETFNGVETEHVVHVTVIGGAGLEENELQNVRVFPNPSKGNFSISGLMSDKPLQLEVRDVHGKLVFEENGISKDLNSFELGVENAIYFVTVLDMESKGFVVEKLVVSR